MILDSIIWYSMVLDGSKLLEIMFIRVINDINRLINGRWIEKPAISKDWTLLNTSLPQPIPSSTLPLLNTWFPQPSSPQHLSSSTPPFLNKWFPLYIYIYIYMYIYIIASCFWHGPFPPHMDIHRWGTDISSDIHPPQPTPPHITPPSTGGCPPTRGGWGGAPSHAGGGCPPTRGGGCPLQF